MAAGTTLSKAAKRRLAVTINRMLKRKSWRKKTLELAMAYVSRPPGKDGREKEYGDLCSAVIKVREWFGQDRAKVVILAIQRRAVEEFRKSS